MVHSFGWCDRAVAMYQFDRWRGSYHNAEGRCQHAFYSDIHCKSKSISGKVSKKGEKSSHSLLLQDWIAQELPLSYLT
jgi:hypothetical protein